MVGVHHAQQFPALLLKRSAAKAVVATDAASSPGKATSVNPSARTSSLRSVSEIDWKASVLAIDATEAGPVLERDGWDASVPSGRPSRGVSRTMAGQKRILPSGWDLPASDTSCSAISSNAGLW